MCDVQAVYQLVRLNPGCQQTVQSFMRLSESVHVATSWIFEVLCLHLDTQLQAPSTIVWAKLAGRFFGAISNLVFLMDCRF